MRLAFGVLVLVCVVPAVSVRAGTYVPVSRGAAARREVTGGVAMERCREEGTPMSKTGTPGPDQLELADRRLRAVELPPHATTHPWRAEGEAMLTAGEMLRSTALTLPESSDVRVDLLASAQDWLLAAKLRGVTARELRSA